MIRLLTDENFNRDIIRGVLRKVPTLDLLRVQDVDLMNTDDPIILAWAAQDRRIVLTHDVQTMVGYANERIYNGLSTPGLIVVRQTAGIGPTVEALILIIECSFDNEWENQVVYLPF